jgi:hypothetical protein
VLDDTYHPPVDRVGAAVQHAVAAFKDATTAPPEVRTRLLAAIGGPGTVPPGSTTPAGVAFQPAAAAAPAAVAEATAQPVAPDAAALSLSALEVKLEELSARIDQLTAAEAKEGGGV